MFRYLYLQVVQAVVAVASRPGIVRLLQPEKENAAAACYYLLQTFVPSIFISLPLMPYKPETLEGVLTSFPEQAHSLTRALFDEYHFLFRITTPRKTRLGCFKGVRYGARPVIHINSDLGPYTFLLVFLHELAHLVVMKKHGRKAKPHGPEWKNAYRTLMQPFFDEQVFPPVLTTELYRYFIKTPATFHRDAQLINTLASLEGGQAIITVGDVPLNSTFTLMSGRQFVKLEKLRTRYKCFCPKTRKYYLVPKSAQVMQA